MRSLGVKVLQMRQNGNLVRLNELEREYDQSSIDNPLLGGRLEGLRIRRNRQEWTTCGRECVISSDCTVVLDGNEYALPSYLVIKAGGRGQTIRLSVRDEYDGPYLIWDSGSYRTKRVLEAA